MKSAHGVREGDVLLRASLWYHTATTESFLLQAKLTAIYLSVTQQIWVWHFIQHMWILCFAMKIYRLLYSVLFSFIEINFEEFCFSLLLKTMCTRVVKRISQNKCLHRRFKYESIHIIHLLYKMLRTVTAGAVTILSASCQRMCIYFCSACHYCWIIFVKTNENKLHMP